ncbi:MAG: diguanylate cyclase [Sulfitobacter sp.]|nr:diguanylate cyclase [Sulfitobacter sp.]
MQGKILIVDAIATNRIVLKVKLQSAFYEVIQADNISRAIERLREDSPDLIITALQLEDGTAADLYRAVREEPEGHSVPLLAVGETRSAEDRLALLETGLRDVIPRPLDEMLLLGRVRSLIRAQIASTEWHLREDTSAALGLAEPEEPFAGQTTCTLVSTDKAQLQSYAAQLRPWRQVRLTLATPTEAMRQIKCANVPDVFVLVMGPGPEEVAGCFRMISALRATAAARYKGILVLQTTADSALGANALDMGADDLMAAGFDAAELGLRVKALTRRTRQAERLRTCVRSGLQAAVFDPLTGLYNRRYAMPHLARIAEHARKTGRCYAVLAADLDHVKSVNDRYGHAAGDSVLAEVARRLREGLRASDMVARIGGEEFMVVMPGTTQQEAQATALRLCDQISDRPFDIPDHPHPIRVTISIGMAISNEPDQKLDLDLDLENGSQLLASADRALYAAKGKGRNRVTLGRPAA